MLSCIQKIQKHFASILKEWVLYASSNTLFVQIKLIYFKSKTGFKQNCLINEYIGEIY
jgi:hypothetical protein